LTIQPVPIKTTDLRESVSYQKGGNMKQSLYGIMITAVMLFVSACATTAPRHMMFKDDPSVNISSVKPENGKAAMVVAWTSIHGRKHMFHGANEFYTYLEKKMIGVTQSKSYFVKTDITPGVYYVISDAETKETVKINFEPDRVYYVHQIPRMGVYRPRIRIALETPEQLMSEFDDDCKLLIYDPEDAGEDLSDEDYKQVVTNYELEVKEGLHKEYEGYRGAAAQ
jgi:hypothetical protein